MLLTTELPNSRLVQKFVIWLCDRMNIKPSEISIYRNDCLSPDVHGLCMDVNDSEFIIDVRVEGRNITDIFITIAHEMVHVKQFMKENLRRWMTEYGDTPYNERWWEIEAFTDSVKFVREFVETQVAR